MLNRLYARLSAAALVLVLAACAAPAPPAPVEIRRGVIEQITPTQIASNQHAGVNVKAHFRVVGELAIFDAPIP